MSADTGLCPRESVSEAPADAKPLATDAEAAHTELPAETVLITSLKLDEEGAAIQFTGRPSQVYILQSATSLNAPAWSSLSTNQANAQGTGSLRDRAAQHESKRFYRIARP